MNYSTYLTKHVYLWEPYFRKVLLTHEQKCVQVYFIALRNSRRVTACSPMYYTYLGIKLLTSIMYWTQLYCWYTVI